MSDCPQVLKIGECMKISSNTEKSQLSTEKSFFTVYYYLGVILIVWQLDLQLPLQSVPITTKL